MVMKALGDKVNRVPVTRVGGNRTAQYLPTTKTVAHRSSEIRPESENYFLDIW